MLTPAQSMLALSYAPHYPDVERRRLEGLARRALQRVCESSPRTVTSVNGMVVLVDDRGERSQRDGDETFHGNVVALSQGPRTTSGEALGPQAIRDRLLRADVGDIAPPFAASVVSTNYGELTTATDAVGLRHMYWMQTRDWASVSSSHLVLSALLGSAIDEASLAALALIGHHLGERTAFEGVHLLPAGATVRLQNGRAEVRVPPTVTDATRPPEPLDRPTAVATGVEVIRSLTTACLRAYPDPLLELSGGLDSRVLLAGIPRGSRGGLRAATVGPSDCADHRIAALLAQHDGLAHTSVTQDGLASLGPSQVLSLVEEVALDRGCVGNPTAMAVLDWQERQLDQGPRVSGQNGEFARGFYYPAQRRHPRVTDDLVDGLARWRLFTNEAVDGRLFADGFLNDLRTQTLKDLRRTFASYGTDWLSATDEFYLHERMRHWVGTSYSSACTRRVIQAPFFHPDYLRWAKSCRPADKRGSRVVAAVLAGLDAELAAMPLDSGTSPRAIATPSRLDRLSRGQVTLRKVSRKIRQYLGSGGRPARGADVLSGGVQDAWAQRAGALQHVAQLPWMESQFIEQVARGEHRLDPASVGLLTNLDVALRVRRGLRA